LEELGQKIKSEREIEEKIAQNKQIPGGKLRILLVPLDWGLGHTTRCFPIIRQLAEAGHEVYLAGNQVQKILFEHEFPALQALLLDGYNIKYSPRRTGMKWKILLQVFKLRKNIHREHEWLKRNQEIFEFDLIISDNRFGLYHSFVPSIFITHQLTIKSGFGNQIDKWLRKINFRYINRFSACWIPDFENENQLAGELSHPPSLPNIPLKYIGILSRFKGKKIDTKKDHILIILSGPEPQRSIFEKIIIRDIAHYQGTATIVRGLPAAESIIPSTGMLKFYNHMPSEDLENEIAQAEFVISRSGYSTVMDLFTMQKKSILIPTPGQPEQEYLGKYLMNRGVACSVKQDRFTITEALQQAAAFRYCLPDVEHGMNFNKLIEDLLKK